MRTRDRGQIAFHEFEVFDKADGKLLAGCTGRAGGVSEPPYDELNLGLHVGDDAGSVLENRRRLARAIDVELMSFVVPNQVHMGHVETITEADRGRGADDHDRAVPDTDALITADSNVALAVMLADCVPVLLYDPSTPAVGIAHAGWGGTTNHITRKTVEAMQREFATNPGEVLAGLGPSIGPGSYEVGRNVRDKAHEAFPHADVLHDKGNGKYLFDLWQSNVTDLMDAGVRIDHIERANIDTCEATDQFFSDRRQRPTGRFMAVVQLRA